MILFDCDWGRGVSETSAAAKTAPPGCINFLYGRPHAGLFGLVERTAAIYPVVGSYRRHSSHVDTVAVVATVTSIQRAALRRRRDDGRLNEAEYLRRVDCRPAFVKARPRCRFCNRFDECIHCWARRAVSTWQAVDTALFPGKGRGRTQQSAFDLVLTVRTWAGAAWRPYAVEGRPDLAAAFADRCGDRKTGEGRLPARGLELRRLRCAGSLDLVTADVAWRSTDRGPAGSWRVEVRQLLALEPGRSIALDGARLRRLATPDRRRVAAAVGRFWRFPRGLVLKGEAREPPAASWIERYLAAREGRRLFAARGIFAGRGRRGGGAGDG